MWINNWIICQRCRSYFPLTWPLSPLKTGIWLLLCCFLPAGCVRDKEKVVQAKVAERVLAFRTKHLSDCRTALLRDAEEWVDSLLLLEATGTLSDSLTRLKPTKPAQPPPLVPIDSLSVRPLFDSTLPPGSGN
jgi:hypothetical protein